MASLTSSVFMRMPELEQYLGLNRTTLYKYIKDGRFPAAIRIGTSHRAVAVWRRDEVDAFVERLTAERNAARPYSPDAVGSVYRANGRPPKAKAVEVAA